LYKRQGIQTDLFGLGAILFDLLTCGESPERFYDNIRVIYDKKEKKVDEIMEDYEKVFSLQSSEPSLVQVFEPFKLHKNSTTYALAYMYLKLTIKESENSYYNSRKEDKERITLLLEDLEKLKRNITDFINSNEMQTVLLRSYLSDELLKEIPTLSQLINNSQIGVSLEFDKLTSSLVEVQSGNMTIRLDDMLTIM
jgi:hypothetical protein